MRRLSEVLKEQYHEKIYKLSLSSGSSCPNRNGKVGYGGCTFCSEGGSGEFAAAPGPISAQIEEAKARISQKTDAGRFIAYFQSYTNTYGDVTRLWPLYEETIRRDDVVILSLGTRPDCLGEDVMEMLCSLRKIKPVWVELGLQTMHDRTAAAVNRGYSLQVFEEGYHKLKAAGLEVIVHIIFGLPGESREDMLGTVRFLSSLQPAPDGVKLQMLHILKNTALGRQYEEHPFPLLSLEDYASLVAESIRILPEETVIHRMTGDGPKKLLLAPAWTADKKRVLNTINRAISQELKLHTKSALQKTTM